MNSRSWRQESGDIRHRIDEVIQAKIVLYAAEGLENKDIAARLDTSPQIVSKWRQRFFGRRMEGLDNAPLRGRPGGFSPQRRHRDQALACELPHELGVPLSRFSMTELRREVIVRGIVASIGEKTIWRWLSEDAIKAWSHRSWLFVNGG